MTSTSTSESLLLLSLYSINYISHTYAEHCSQSSTTLRWYGNLSSPMRYTYILYCILYCSNWYSECELFSLLFYPHVHTLQPIVVMGPSPTLCANTVQALVRYIFTLTMIVSIIVWDPTSLLSSVSSTLSSMPQTSGHSSPYMTLSSNTIPPGHRLRKILPSFSLSLSADILFLTLSKPRAYIIIMPRASISP